MDFLLDFLQTSIDGVMFGSTYALMAVGFTLIWGLMRILNLAHGETVMVGMFVGMVLTKHAGLPLPIAFLGSVVGGMGVGLVAERVCYRPLRKAHELVPMIATLGLWMFLEELFTHTYFYLYFHDYVRFPSPSALMGVDIGPFRLRVDYLITLGVATVLVFLLYAVVYRTKMGLALRMIAESHDIAYLMGVNVPAVLTLAFCIASGFGGAAGFLLGMSTSMANPYSGTLATVKGLFVMILGGSGSTAGAIAGGLLLGFLELQSAYLISFAYRDAVAMGLLFLILVFRPQGLFGARGTERV